jgi:hypothetical protein
MTNSFAEIAFSAKQYYVNPVSYKQIFDKKIEIDEVQL